MKMKRRKSSEHLIKTFGSSFNSEIQEEDQQVSDQQVCPLEARKRCQRPAKLLLLPHLSALADLSVDPSLKFYNDQDNHMEC